MRTVDRSQPSTPGVGAGPPVGGGDGLLPAPAGQLDHPARGRDELIGQLVGLVGMPDDRFRVLVGLGGLGKTTVAIEVARQARAGGHRVWWITASDAAAVNADLLAVAEALGADPASLSQAREGQRSGSDLLWQCLEATSGWLLVFDNADDPQLLARPNHRVGEGNGWLRPSRRGLVLVTSRRTDAAVWGGTARLHRLAALRSDASAIVLRDLAPAAGGMAEAASLAQRLGRLPLALRLAGSYLADPFAEVRTFEGYRRQLDRNFLSLLSPPQAEPVDPRRVVVETWELSLADLERRHLPQARGLLRLLAWFAPATPVPVALLQPSVLVLHGILDAAVTDPDHGLVAGLRALGSLGLVQTEFDRSGVGTTALHPLVAETQRHRTPPQQRARYINAAVSLIDGTAQANSPDDPSTWPHWLRLAPHLRSLLPVCRDPGPLGALVHAAGLAVWAAGDNGNLADAETLARHALACAQPVLGAEHTRILNLRHALAAVLGDLGQHEAAEQEYRAIYEIRRRVYGDEHFDTMSARHGLAQTLLNRGLAAESAAQFGAVLETKRRALGDDHPHTIASRVGRAAALRELDHLDEAHQEFDGALAALCRVLGDDHQHAWKARQQLALTVARQGDLSTAAAMLRTVVDARRRILNDDHPDTLLSRYHLGCILHNLGQLDDAAAELTTARDAGRRTLGADHPLTRTCADRLDSVVRARAAASG